MSEPLSDVRMQLLLISQEQDSQIKSLGEIRLALTALLERVRGVEQHIATLEAAHQAHITGGIQGLDGSVTVTFPPEWGESVPLVEVERGEE